MTRSEARQIALDYVKDQQAKSGIELSLLDEHTIERDFGWVFFYGSKKFVETGDIQYLIAGNAPIVITRTDGRIHETGTAYPIEHYLRKFSP
jgi:hypothetical protein